ncbi:hypothetical protein IRJ41_009535, partial [Triplophysa rosa]
CCSASSSLVSSPSSVVTARAYDRCLISRPANMISLIRVYCSRSATRFSSNIILLSFSMFCSLRAFTSSRPMIIFCCCLTTEISSDN